MELSAIIERGIDIAGRNDRPDLRLRLEQAARRLRDPHVRVLVVGEFKQGKSQLVNALVGAPVCPVDDDIATSVPTTVRYGATPSAAILMPAPEGSLDGPQRVPTPVSFDLIPDVASERGNPGNQRGIAGVEVAVPAAVLKNGLALVDSPGVGGLSSPHSLITVSALPTAHALLLVTDASQEFTEPEMQFLRMAMRICPNTSVVLTKTDLSPHWRQIAQLDRAHLDRQGLSHVPIIPVSSALRILALQRKDQQLDAESGVPELLRHLRENVVGRSAELNRRATAQDLRTTAEQLSLSLGAERQAIEEPESTPRLLAELQQAKERADELRKNAAKWQVTLGDGIGDLITDLDYDLRDRMRRVQREAEDAIDAGDPGPIWPQFVAWFDQRVTAAVTDTFVWTNERARWLAGTVADHFEDEAIALPAIEVSQTEGVLDPVGALGDVDSGHLSLFQKSFVTMRGSYGGVLMVGLVTSIMGMALINPISLAAGVVLGGKAYQDDKRSRLARRQAEGKLLVRRQVDDVIFQVGKQLKDRIRLVQRATRDHFTQIADLYHRTIGDSVTAAQKAASLYEAEAKTRLAQLRTELAQVEWLAKAAAAVDPETEGAERRETGADRPAQSAGGRPPAAAQSAAGGPAR